MLDDDIRELYQEIILDHGKNPRNFRRPADANRQAAGHNPLCGDRITVYITVSADNQIQDAAFEGKGCAISQASASLMTDVLKGKTVADAEALFRTFHHLCTVDAPADEKDVDPEALDRLKVLAGVRQFPMRVKCATLSWHALHAALTDPHTVSTE